MEDSRYFTDPQEQITYLRDMTDAAFRIWVTTFLSRGLSGRVVLPDRSRDRAHDLVELCKADSTHSLTDRITKIIGSVFSDAYERVNDPALVIGALIVIGELGVASTYDKLVNIAKTHTERLWELQYDGVNALEVLLRVLIGLEDSFDLDVVLERETTRPRYAKIIFRGLWEHGGDRGTWKAIKFLPRLMDFEVKDRSFHLEHVLVDFMASLGWSNFVYLIPDIFASVGPQRIEQLLLTLGKIGIRLMPDSEYCMTMDWRLVGNGDWCHQIIPSYQYDKEPGITTVEFAELSSRYIYEARSYMRRLYGIEATRVVVETQSYLQANRTKYEEALINSHRALELAGLANHEEAGRDTIELLSRVAAQ